MLKGKAKICQSLVIVVAFLVVLVSPSVAVRASVVAVIKLTIGSPVMIVDGLREPIDSQGTKPVIVQGRTLVPIRAIIEAFGGSVSWNAAAAAVSVQLGGSILNLRIGSQYATLNGSSLPIDSTNARITPVIMNNRTMLPLRFVGESLGLDVQWEAATATITISMPASSGYCPPVVLRNLQVVSF